MLTKMSVDEAGENTHRLKIFARLKPVIEAEIMELERAYRERRLSAIAWTARNLLELYVWTNYCCASEDNAKTFDEDSARDVVDLMKIAHLLETVEAQSYLLARTKIITDAKAGGFQSIDDGYLRVSAAAESFGFGDIFKMANKALSKFAHPSALLMVVQGGAIGKILVNGVPAEEAIRQEFYDGARHFAESALNAIKDFCETH